MSICFRDTYNLFVGQSEDLIKTEIKRLKGRIKYLKRKIKMQDESGEKVCPSPWLELEIAREELSEAKRVYIDSGYVYEKTLSEIKKEKFLEGLEGLKEFSLCTMVFLCGPGPIWSVDVDGEIVRGYYSNIGDTNGEIKAESERFEFKKSEFLQLLEELDIDEWRRRYDNPLVLDGESWEIKLTYHDKKAKTYRGTNAYPFSYYHLLERLEEKRREYGQGLEHFEAPREKRLFW